MAKIKLTLGKYSGDIEKRLQYISSGSILDVFPDSFIQNYTNCHNLTDFLKCIGCDMASLSDLDKLDSGFFDESVKEQSNFESWEDMAETAYQLQIKKN